MTKEKHIKYLIEELGWDEKTAKDYTDWLYVRGLLK